MGDEGQPFHRVDRLAFNSFHPLCFLATPSSQSHPLVTLQGWFRLIQAAIVATSSHRKQAMADFSLPSCRATTNDEKEGGEKATP